MSQLRTFFQNLTADEVSASSSSSTATTTTTTVSKHQAPPFSEQMDCCICQVSLQGIRRFKHNCRNCGESVCGSHSRRNVPLPHFGILKEVRICDRCHEKLVVQRRVGFRSPRTSVSGPAMLSREPNDSSSVHEKERTTKRRTAAPVATLPTTNNKKKMRLMTSTKNKIKAAAKRESLKRPMFRPGRSNSTNVKDGILGHYQVEVQNNTMDDLLYIGSLRLGSRSLASRNLNANLVLWKERTLVLTHSEVLCLKSSSSSNYLHAPSNKSPKSDDADDDEDEGSEATLTTTETSPTSSEALNISELKTSVHMTDILFIEIHEHVPRVITILRNDGRIFRLRATSESECRVIYEALESTRKAFQGAMYALLRGPQDCDHIMTVVSIQVEEEAEECVVAHFPVLDQTIDLFGSGLDSRTVLRVYVSGPAGVGVASFLNLAPDLALWKKNVEEEEEERLVSVFTSRVVYSGNNNNNHHHHREDRSRPDLEVELVLITTRHSSSGIKILALSMLLLLVAVVGFFEMWWFVSVLVCVLGLTKLWVDEHWVDNVFLEMKMTREWPDQCWPFVWTSSRVSIRRIRQVDPTLLNVQRLDLDRKTIGQETRELKEEEEEEEEEEMILDSEVDIRYVEGCRGNMKEAKDRYRRTRKWRKRYEVDSILTRAQPHFVTMMSCYTKYIHKRDKWGHVVSFETAGSLRKCMQDFMNAGVSVEQAVLHEVFCAEYLWRIADTRGYPASQQLVVLDLRGISLGDMSGDVVSFMKEIGSNIGDNYPERLFRVFIVHPPSWFHVLWKIVAPLINPKTRDKTHVVRGAKEIRAELLKFIDLEDLPLEYGGTCACPGGCATGSAYKLELGAYVDRLNEDQGIESKEEEASRIEALEENIKVLAREKKKELLEMYPKPFVASE